MFRKSKKSKGKKIAYWALVESYRTVRGPRQRVVAYLEQIGDEEIVDKAIGLKDAANNKSQPKFVPTRFSFDGDDTTTQSEWVEVNISGLTVKNKKHFGGPWIALELIRLLKLDTFLKTCLPQGEEVVPWHLVSQILVICRLLKDLPSRRMALPRRWCQLASRCFAYVLHGVMFCVGKRPTGAMVSQRRGNANCGAVFFTGARFRCDIDLL